MIRQGGAPLIQTGDAAQSSGAPSATGDQSAQPAQTAPANDKESQPAQTPAPAGDAATQPADSYVIGAADVLIITVWKEPTLSGSILVRPDGMISLSLLGDVQASGMTPTQLANQISTKLKKFIQEPNVSVVVSQIHSKVVYLLGEVNKKGPVEMTQGMTLLEAISSAGGLTDYANQKKIYILRTESGSQQRIPVRYKEALKGDGTLNLALKPGDTIVVP
jgi:polysaccharide export outer membrane protein